MACFGRGQGYEINLIREVKKRRPKKNIIQFTCGVGECNLLLNFNNTIVI